MSDQEPVGWRVNVLGVGYLWFDVEEDAVKAANGHHELIDALYAAPQPSDLTAELEKNMGRAFYVDVVRLEAEVERLKANNTALIAECRAQFEARLAAEARLADQPSEDKP